MKGCRRRKWMEECRLSWSCSRIALINSFLRAFSWPHSRWPHFHWDSCIGGGSGIDLCRPIFSHRSFFGAPFACWRTSWKRPERTPLPSALGGLLENFHYISTFSVAVTFLLPSQHVVASARDLIAAIEIRKRCTHEALFQQLKVRNSFQNLWIV